MKKTLNRIATFGVFAIFAFALGCSSDSGDGGIGITAPPQATLVAGVTAPPQVTLANGVWAEVIVEVRTGGLYTSSISLGDAQENDGEDEDDNDDAEDGGAKDAGADRKFEFIAAVDSVSSDLSAFSVLGGVRVVMEPDDDDGADDDAAAEEEDLKISALQAGMRVEVKGHYSEEDGTFYAEEITPADESLTVVEGVISDLGATSFTLLGLQISYDDTTIINPESDEDGADDGITCEQEGENEGDNVACK